mmetsp:Transcript_18393/g.19150  ORF Transcript_18393/g.19150 Transcript_18393/m.19150 type:complete len:220 (+) Transcript_18393:37-696(+)
MTSKDRFKLYSNDSSNNLDIKSIENKISEGNMTDEELATLSGLKTIQISEFREIFRIFDNNEDGFVDQVELRRMMQSLHFDNLLLSDDYFIDLIKRVKGRDIDINSSERIYFSFYELMLCMLQRPVVNYRKKDVLNAFSILAGKSEKFGTISEVKLSRALYRGNGGTDPLLAEDIMAMVEHTPGGRINYQELVDLMMGVDEVKSRHTNRIHKKTVKFQR